MRHGSCEMVPGYRLDLLLESGVKGEVYRAREISSGQSCLIRILAPNEKYSREFLNEANLAAALFHPSVVYIYEAGILESGDLFVVAEDAGGHTLRELLNGSGVPSLLTAIEIARQAAEAVHALHLNGLVHRALNPANIILTTDAEGRLLVKLQNPDLGGAVNHSVISNKFLIDSALDSIRYFAPEQCSGNTAGAQTDVYSLGIVLFELLAGMPPFDAPNAAGVIEKHRSQPPPELKIDNFDLRMLLTHTLMESLQKQPRSRHSSANAFARQLRHMEQLATHSSTPPPAVAVAQAASPAASTGAGFAAARARVSPQPMTEMPRMVYAADIRPAPARVENEPPSIETVRPPIAANIERASVHTGTEYETTKTENAPHPAFRVEMADAPDVAGQVLEIESVSVAPPEVGDTAFEQPGMEKPLAPETTHHPSRLLRIRRRKKKWHPVVTEASPAIKTGESFSATETGDVNVVEAPIPPTEISTVRAQPEMIAKVPSQIAPIRIQWDQPDDDIPSEADVLEVLRQEGMSLPDARTGVSAAPQEYLYEEDLSSSVSDPAEFVPVFIEAADTAKMPEPYPGQAIFSSYSGRSAARFTVGFRSLMVGGGCTLLMVLYLFRGGFLSEYVGIAGPGDSVVAESAPPQTAFPQIRQPDAVQTAEQRPAEQREVKSSLDTRRADDAPDINQLKPLSGKDGPAASREKPGNVDLSSASPSRPTKPATIDRNVRSIPSISTTLVISSEKGKIRAQIEPDRRSGDKKSTSIPIKTAGLTRPRIVKEARP
jgi:serine/threonine protein kinase